MSRSLIKNAKLLLGIHPPGTRIISGRSMADLPSIENAWLTTENGSITGFGTMDDLSKDAEAGGTIVIDASDRLVLPGWCDPHTHVVFAAPRENEFVDRIKGLTYQQIAANGGGILNSAGKLREMAEEALFQQACSRLIGMMDGGTVAVEIKSGYGLSYESELLMLRVIARLRREMPLPIKSTLLAAHALPAEYQHDRKGYIDMVCDRLIPQVAREELADHVDVFCETNYFSVDEMVRVLEKGREYGLRPKVHVNQFTSIGGIKAAIEQQALSVDHLEIMEDRDLEQLAVAHAGDTAPIPTLLPSCSFFLRIPYAPARRMMDLDIPIALATDFNPGSTPSGNMNFVLSLACIQLRMLPQEAINATTMNAAAAMDISDRNGSIAIGKAASLIITKKVPSLAYLPYAFGADHIDTVLIDGRPVRSGEVLS